MIKVWAIRLSVALNLLAVIAALAIWLNASSLILGFLEPGHARKVSFFEVYPVPSKNAVFLGDSITQGGEWAEIFPDLAVKNRGIGGDTTTGVLERLHQVTNGQPSAVYIKIGTNDLTHGPDQRETSYRQYKEIIARVQKDSPSTHIYVQSLLPRAADRQLEVEAFNGEIQRLATQMDVTYIDLYSHFLDPDGSIADKFSNDELHLSGEGYQLWQSLLAPYLAEIRKKASG
jgi:lysophospholipase L1-like esterase